MTNAESHHSNDYSTDPWRVAWQIVTGKLALGIILLALALTFGLYAWLPQAPAHGIPSSIAYITWQTTVTERFGSLGSILEKLDLFHIREAAWFRILLALMALLLVARLIDALESLWARRQIEAPPTRLPALKVDREMEDVLAELRQRRFRLCPLSLPKLTHNTQDAEAVSMVVADRWPLGELGPILIYLGGLILLLGLVITARSSWRSEVISLVAGHTSPIAHNTGLAFQLDELAADGQSGRGTLERDGVLVEAGDLAIGQPLAAEGLGVYLVGNGPGILVSGTLGQGQPLELRDPSDPLAKPSLALVFSDDDPRQHLEAPDAGIYLQLTLPRPVELGTMPQVQVYSQQSGELLVEEEASVDQPLEIGDSRFDFKPIAHAKILFAHDPGAWWVQIGGLILGAGLLLRGAWPSRRLWIRRQPDGIDVLGDTIVLQQSGTE